MVGLLIRRISLWWRFKQLDRTYQPLIEKALAFENREALLKLEEQYWYQSACLIEERRMLNKARFGPTVKGRSHNSPAGNAYLN